MRSSLGAAVGALLLCAPVLLVSSPGLAQPSPTVDVAVTGLSLVGPAPEWAAGVAKDGAIDVVVSNLGTAPVAYQVTAFWKVDGTETPLNGDEASSFTVSSMPIPAGGDAHHEIPWRLQGSQRDAGSIVARVAAAQAADSRPDNDERALAVFVPVRSMSAELDGAAAQVRPGGTGFFRLRLDNHGNVPAFAHVAVDSYEEDPRLQVDVSPESPVVPAGGSVHTAVLARFLPEGDERPISTTFRLRVDAGFGPLLENVTEVLTTVPGSSDLSGYAWDIAFLGSSPMAVATGATTVLPFRVQNTGTEADNYTFEVAGPPGWGVTLVPDRPAVLAGESVTVAAAVTVPADAPSGQTSGLRIAVRGSLVATPTELDVQLHTGGAVLRVASLSFIPAPYKGHPATLAAVLANPGDQPIPAGTASLRWTQGVAASDAAVVKVSALPPGSSAKVSAVLAAPVEGGAIQGDLVWSTQAGTTAATTTAIVHVPVMSIDPASAAAGAPGETLAFRIPPKVLRITNVGNAPETLSLAVTPSAGRAQIENAVVLTLAPKESRSVPFTVTLPRPSGEIASVDVRLSAWIDGYDFGWTATSKVAVVDAERPTGLWAGLPARWPVDEPLPLAADAMDDSLVAKVSAKVTRPDGTIVRQPMHRDSGTRWVGWVALPQAGENQFVLEVEDQSGKAVNSPPHSVHTVEVPAPVLSWVAGQEGAELPQGSNLTLSIEDPLEVRFVRFRFDQDGVVHERTVPVSEGLATVALLGLEAGDVTVEATAANVAGRSARMELNVTIAAAQAALLDDAGPARPDSHGAPSVSVVLMGTALAGLAAALRRKSA